MPAASSLLLRRPAHAICQLGGELGPKGGNVVRVREKSLRVGLGYNLLIIQQFNTFRPENVRIAIEPEKVTYSIVTHIS